MGKEEKEATASSLIDLVPKKLPSFNNMIIVWRVKISETFKLTAKMNCSLENSFTISQKKTTLR